MLQIVHSSPYNKVNTYNTLLFHTRGVFKMLHDREIASPAGQEKTKIQNY